MKLNSERVPNKNFKSIGDKPLFSWMLDTLLSLNKVGEIIINTDAPIELFESYTQNSKLKIRQRKEELCGDFVSMNDIIADDITESSFSNFIMTHTTNPLISKNTFNKAIDIYENFDKLKYDSLFSATKFQGRFYDSDHKALNHDPNNLIRTQDLPPLFLENSCIYIFNRKSFLTSNARIGAQPIIFETPTLESIDIDTQDEWFLADRLIASKER